MRVISLNVNGLRSASQKGALKWLAQQMPDVVCLQELKAQPQDLGDQHLCIGDTLTASLHCAQRPGYSGVAVYGPIDRVCSQIGIDVPEFDAEGRVLRVDLDGLYPVFPSLSVVSLYAPSGSASADRQASKFRFLSDFLKTLRAWMGLNTREGREFLICGDWNIAHTEKDLKNWKGNLRNSGFLPEERAWLSQVFDEIGWVDVYRKLFPQAQGEGYTWWSNRGQARAKNVGWRIDYQVATPKLAERASDASVYTAERFSDHAPLIVDFNLQAK